MSTKQWTINALTLEFWITLDCIFFLYYVCSLQWLVSVSVSVLAMIPSPSLASFVGQLAVCRVQTGQHQAEPSLHPRLRPRLLVTSHTLTLGHPTRGLHSAHQGRYVVPQSLHCWPRDGWGWGVHGGRIMNQPSVGWYLHIFHNFIEMTFKV